MQKKAVEFTCEKCKVGLRVPGDNEIKFGRCPKCGERIRIPVPSSDDGSDDK